MKMEDSGPLRESLKSDRSMEFPIAFRNKCSENEADFPDLGPEPNPKIPDQQWSQTQLDAIFKPLEEHIVTFVKDELKRLHWILCLDYPEFLDSEEEEEEQSIRKPFLNITLEFLKRMKQKQLAERLHNRCLQESCQSKLKCHLKQSFSHVSEGINVDGNRTLLNQIYTELYITEGGAAGVNQEHEVKHIEAVSRKTSTSETTIKCEDIFKGPTHRGGSMKAEQTETRANVKMKKKPLLIKGLLTKIPSGLEKRGPNKKDHQQIGADLIKRRGSIRTVLMKGVAGIGKTVLTQKFSLDWAEGRANQDIQLLFPFTFRELNVLRDTRFSLVALLQHFFSESKGLSSFQHLQVLFIFDGLDECRLSLDFSRTRVLSDPTESTSVDVLLVNLIRGRLLPSALLWITTRPAAASQIPAEYISMVTEVRGFSDPQKEYYFRKRFKDEKEAVISHIKKLQSLNIMCHIPIFCWILSRVLQYVLKTSERGELPQTLTQMYVHFLVVQAKVKSRKYDGRSETDPPWTPKNREMVLSLGKLAFEQLQKGNLIFYEFDLRDSGLNLKEASVYSGVFNQVFKEESGLYQDKVYCFLHLSVQEFLAALHVHQTFFSSGVNLLSTSLSSVSPGSESETAFYCSAVDQALESPNGHLDLFLRFLLGLSLKTNQHLLTGLLTTTENSSQVNRKTIEYIKKRIDEDLSTERSINLFHCLNELNDHTLVEQIQQTITKGRFSNLSPAQWSALVFILLSSDSVMEVFDLKRYSASPNAFLKLLPVIKASNKAILSSCFLSSSCCGPLSSAICSEFSNLTHLDLSDNDLQDSGVELLCSGLKSAPCRLEALILSSCFLSSSCCGPLSLVLCSESSSLTHLDVSANGLQDSGVELLCCGLKSTHCRLKTLSLNACKLSQSCCASLSSVLKTSCLTHLNLSYNNLKDSGVELLCSGQKSAPCRLETLGLSFCNLSQGSCVVLSTVLSSSSLMLLDLSDNFLKDSGVEVLCSGLKSASCRLETLRLSGCVVSDKGGAALASALNSTHSHLKELDLSYNHIESSTKLLTRLRVDPRFPLETLRLNPFGAHLLTPGLRKYLCDLSLDLNTAHRALQLSEDQRTVTHVDEEQPYPDHPDRFDSRPQVLTSTALTRRCYWEVKWEGCAPDQPGWVDISVCYKTLKRKGSGKECLFGLNYESWTLGVFKGQYSFRHKGREFRITCASSHVAVYLDPSAGFLAFYEVYPDGSQGILHCLNTTFTETLVAGFGSYRSSIRLI